MTEEAKTKRTETFKCVDCGETKPVAHEGGTGYAERREADKHGPAGKVCYACCGEADRSDLETNDRATLYLVKRDDRWVVTNWPGTLEFRCHSVSKGSHNIARTRLDAWFRDHTGREWWAVQYGEWTEVAHCRKLKAKNRGAV